MRITDRNDWFELWFDDKNAIITTMVSNMTADLNAGYNYFGASIRSQREMIDTYKAKFDRQMDEFKTMDVAAVNRWCYYTALGRRCKPKMKRGNTYEKAHSVCWPE